MGRKGGESRWGGWVWFWVLWGKIRVVWKGDCGVAVG